MKPKPSEIYGDQPMQMDDYGMAPEHYDSCDNCNSHEHYKTHNDETETEENI